VKLTCEFSEAHVRALEKVIDGLDYETIEAIAKSPQEGYDIIFCLQSLRDAIKVAQNPPSAPSKSAVVRFSSAPSGGTIRCTPQYSGRTPGPKKGSLTPR
jgi:hypothetical protein